MSAHKFVFVGQGPNRTAWETGLAWGKQVAAEETAPSGAVDLAEFERIVLGRAERYCARLSLTGAVGQKIADLLGLQLHDFFVGFERRNLNLRWNGKSGKGDVFDREEARLRGLDVLKEGFDRIVCVGAEVGAAFGIGKLEPLGERGRYIPVEEDGKPAGERYVSYFLLPHPSGIVQWWNDDFNRFRAKKRLREFLETHTNE